MEQTKALNALEPFLALAKSATSPRAAADLVTRATSAPNTFFFAELLQTPQIQALSQSDEFSPFLTLLQQFSYGTYTSYNQSTPALPPLTDAQHLKLRQLSLLTHARDRVLSYSALTSLLGFTSPRELEDVVISSVYAGLVDATLDPVRETVQIHAVAPLRDVAPQSVPDLLASLQSWSAACEDTLADLEAQIRDVREKADARAQQAAAAEARLAKLVQDETENPTLEAGSGGRGAGGGGHGALSGRGQRLGGGGGGGLGFRGQGFGGARFGKRGIGHMDAASGGGGVPGGKVDDEAMDLDEDDEADAKNKKNSKRKIQG